MDEKFPQKTSIDESKGEMLIECNHMDQATNMGGMYVLKSSKEPSEIIVHCHCKHGKRYPKLNSFMVNI